MEIRLGAEAIGSDGSLGHIERFFLDPESRKAEQMTIKHGLGPERVVHLMHVTGVENDKVQLNIDKAALNSAEPFDERAYRAPGLHISTEPDLSTGHQMPPITGSQLGETDAPPGPSVEGMPGQPGPEFTPESAQEYVISRDTEVTDRDGKKAGKVANFSVDNVTGQPLALSIKGGGLFADAVQVPLELVEDYGPEGILLKATRDQIK